MKTPESSQTNIAVLGGGSWGTALVKILTDNGHHVFWYIRDPLVITSIQETGTNPNYIKKAELDRSRLTLSNELEWTVDQSQHLLLAIPSAYIGPVLEKIKNRLSQKTILTAVKGIVSETQWVVGEHLEKHLGVPHNQIGVIGGPSHAEEVANEQLSYLTLAFPDKKIAQCWADRLACAYIRTKASKDVIGIEYAAMLKNIYALAAGIAHGLGYGDNFQSVLMSNAIREMKRYIRNVHRLKRNINNSAYLGDLLVTGYSSFSRNRTFGNLIGKGYAVHAAQAEMNMIAEGYYATKSAKLMAVNFNTRTPIIDAVYQILYENKNVQKTFLKLTKKLD